MLYFNFKDGKVSAVLEPMQRNTGDTFSRTVQCRADGWTWERACEVAAQANELKDGNTYVATDAGASTSPRYDVQRLPKVGDAVSYSFNGDTYPDGEIVKVTSSLKVLTTSTGSKYWRRRLSGSWVKDKTWFLVAGHHTTRNPSF